MNKESCAKVIKEFCNERLLFKAKVTENSKERQLHTKKKQGLVMQCKAKMIENSVDSIPVSKGDKNVLLRLVEKSTKSRITQDKLEACINAITLEEVLKTAESEKISIKEALPQVIEQQLDKILTVKTKNISFVKAKDSNKTKKPESNTNNVNSVIQEIVKEIEQSEEEIAALTCKIKNIKKEEEEFRTTNEESVEKAIEALGSQEKKIVVALAPASENEEAKKYLIYEKSKLPSVYVGYKEFKDVIQTSNTEFCKNSPLTRTRLKTMEQDDFKNWMMGFKFTLIKNYQGLLDLKKTQVQPVKSLELRRLVDRKRFSSDSGENNDQQEQEQQPRKRSHLGLAHQNQTNNEEGEEEEGYTQEENDDIEEFTREEFPEELPEVSI